MVSAGYAWVKYCWTVNNVNPILSPCYMEILVMHTIVVHFGIERLNNLWEVSLSFIT